MLFTSNIFFFWFLPVVLLSYYTWSRGCRTHLLVLSSYVFYGWWRADFTLLMALSTAVDFFCGRGIVRIGKSLEIVREEDAPGKRRLKKLRKRYLLVSLFVNLGLLAYFKYANFGIDSLNLAISHLGLEPVEWPEVVLPIGISFYTFQTMSYTIDLYRGVAPPVRSFSDFACYVALFPQLVAGPIVRYRTLAEQLHSRVHSLKKFADGAFLLQMGMVKKVLLADIVARVADGAYGMAVPSPAEAWLGTVAYAFQIYFDFSGYSDMAIGLGMMFGFVFPVNFDSPYKSRSITEFWRRWHISLSSWLRDYLYLPLGGNRKGAARTYVNLAITMLLGGLWHGAAWTFVAWGAYQGLWLIIERALGKRPLYARLPGVVQIGATFVIVLGGWVFFRAETFGQAFTFFHAMFALDGWSVVRFEVGRLEGFALVACALTVWTAPNSAALARRSGFAMQALVAVLFLCAMVHLFFVDYTPFLYFRF